ncbi:glycerophosphodiester phosphodiesterase family protein [Streptomyces sp. NPDC094049]|uniref:glycerophosphodiester phosphodiesterase n=1 Tax=Streptomyces sp. NPDC094049 TaxID=3154987 RepID=UPI0033209576
MRDPQPSSSRSRRRATVVLTALAAVAGIATAVQVAAPPSPSAALPVADASAGALLVGPPGPGSRIGVPAPQPQGGGRHAVPTGDAKNGTLASGSYRATRPSGRLPLRAAGAPPTVIAHRGASSAAPENTLVSDEVARRGRAVWIENDVQPSKDGVPYVLHDTTVDRTTDGEGPIRSLTAAQINALDAGSWFAPVYAGTRVPTLAAQLKDLRERGGKMLLEIKGPHSRAEVARIVQEVRDQDMTGRVLVQSFDPVSLRYTRELAPELPLGLLRDTLDADPVAVAGELGLAAYNVSDGALRTRPELVGQLHAAGVAVHVWTVDTPARWKALDALGVDGIITNRPTELGGWASGRTG